MTHRWNTARVDGNPRYVYGPWYERLVLRWNKNQWLVEWVVNDAAGRPIVHVEPLPGTLTELEAQAAALVVWRMR